LCLGANRQSTFRLLEILRVRETPYAVEVRSKFGRTAFSIRDANTRASVS